MNQSARSLMPKLTALVVLLSLSIASFLAYAYYQKRLLRHEETRDISINTVPMDETETVYETYA